MDCKRAESDQSQAVRDRHLSTHINHLGGNGVTSKRVQDHDSSSEEELRASHLRNSSGSIGGRPKSVRTSVPAVSLNSADVEEVDCGVCGADKSENVEDAEVAEGGEDDKDLEHSAPEDLELALGVGLVDGIPIGSASDNLGHASPEALEDDKDLGGITHVLAGMEGKEIVVLGSVLSPLALIDLGSLIFHVEGVHTTRERAGARLDVVCFKRSSVGLQVDGEEAPRHSESCE